MAPTERKKPPRQQPPTKAPSPKQQTQRPVWLLVAGGLVVLWLGWAGWQQDGTERGGVMAGAGTAYDRLRADVKCGTYSPEVPGCTPTQCGRVVRDGLFGEDAIARLKSLCEKGMAYGGGSGGPTILDLHTGALSHGEQFVNVYKVSKLKNETPFTRADIDLYKQVKDTIRATIEKEFGVTGLHLTKPTFFSRITSRPAKTVHDRYWEAHVDRDTYGSFVYTSLLYLNTQGTDYEVSLQAEGTGHRAGRVLTGGQGGEFVFLDPVPGNSSATRRTVVQPRAGRLSFFTSGGWLRVVDHLVACEGEEREAGLTGDCSGAENVHQVTQVTSGVRYAITISFTCSKEQAIADPSME